MPDSINYSSGTIVDWASDPDYQYNLFTAIRTFAQTLEGLGIGWEVLEFTGEGDASPAYSVEWSGTDIFLGHNPLAEAYAKWQSQGGIQIPTLDVSSFTEVRTLYLRWSDGNSDTNENYFFVTVRGTPPWDMSCGVYPHPVTSEIIKKLFLSGSIISNLPTISDTGWAWSGGTKPTDITNLYDEAEVDAIIGTTFVPPSTRNVAGGYQDRAEFDSESISNDMVPQAEVLQDINYHLFGGVDQGVPYFYIVINTGEYYSTMGVGRLAKIGTWKGGMFSGGTWWHPTLDREIFGDYHHSRFLDDRDNYYSSSRSQLYYSDVDLRPYDSEDPTTLPDRYRFGYWNRGSYWAKSDMTGQFLQSNLKDNSFSRFNGRAVTFPNYITVNDANPNFNSIIGITPAIRPIQMDNILPNDLITDLNGQSWRVFPPRKKWESPSGYPDSGAYGYAFRVS